MEIQLFAILLVGAYAAPYDTTIMTEWNDYKTRHEKQYNTVEEDNRRLEIYLANKKKVQEHNRLYEQGQTSFKMDLNKFADWYPEERDKLHCLGADKPRPGRNLFRLEPGKEVPDSINWVTKGAVTSVKDQTDCGSCYAFSAVGALEGLMFRTNKTIESLSAQEIVDCSQDFGNYGCSGGWPQNAFSYVADRGGVDSDESYKYERQEGKCRAEEGTIVASCKDYMLIGVGNETALKEAVGTVGPVSHVFADSFHFYFYGGGIYDGDCGDDINHAMLIVGYGTDNATGKDYWLVKNSWGEWGEKGYARIIRGKNKCQIADLACYPIY